MDVFRFSMTGPTIEFADVAGHGHVRMVPGKVAKRLGDLMLHDVDLSFAQDCLERLEAIAETDEIVASALWHSAVVHVFKCFGGGAKARGQLPGNKYFGTSKESKRWFEFFDNIRNKHFVHDDNAYSQAVPMITINEAGADEHISLHPITASTPTINGENKAALRKIIDVAKAALHEDIKICKAKVMSELQSMSHQELLSLPKASFSAGTPDVVHLTRDTAQRTPGL